MEELSSTERLVLLGLVTFPDMKDTEVAGMLDLPNSTFASVKSRLREMDYYRDVFIPNYPRLGYELLATVYSDFNPSVPVEERVANTKKSVEIYPEMLLSMGESHRGFSLSIANNITRIMRISHERMKILADLNLLEIELPIEVYFPFEMSHVHRFFNLSPLIYSRLKEIDPSCLDRIGIKEKELTGKDPILDQGGRNDAKTTEDVDLTRKQLEILYHTLKHPELSASKLSTLIKHSRHTISRTQQKLRDEGYVSLLRIPDFSRLDSFILSLYHVRIDPKKPIEPDICRNRDLLQDEVIFFISKPTELILLAIYENYVSHNHSKSRFNQFLKSNDYMKWIPNIRNHSLNEAIWIKSFETHSLIRDTFKLKVR